MVGLLLGDRLRQRLTMSVTSCPSNESTCKDSGTIQPGTLTALKWSSAAQEGRMCSQRRPGSFQQRLEDACCMPHLDVLRLEHWPLDAVTQCKHP